MTRMRNPDPARLAALLALVAALALTGCKRRPPPDPGPAAVRIGSATWAVELATDDETRSRGLGGRTELADDSGMLFVFDREEVLQFYMLDCRIPLDVAYISRQLMVVNIRTMVVEDDPAVPKAYYSSKFPALYALEVPAGVFKRRGVKCGDRVELLGAARDAAKDAR